MQHAAAFMSQKQDWTTPRPFFEYWNRRYNFTLDAASDDDNALCERHYTVQDDALSQAWEGVVWCNPPYSSGIGEWVRKGYLEAQKGATVVMLIPSRTDTSWWHTYVMHAEEIVLVRGRLRFGGDTAEESNSAPFPSCVVIFTPGIHNPRFTTMSRTPSEWRQEVLA